MIKHCAVLLLLIAITISGYGADGDALWKEFRSLASRETDPRECEEIAQTYLASLTKPQFFELIKAYARDPEYAKSGERPIGMTIYCHIYLTKGAGRGEPFFQTLRDASDSELPSECKMGLLGALNIPSRQDMSTSETQAMISRILFMSRDKGNEELLRIASFSTVSGFLFRRLHLISKDTPELTETLRKEDFAALIEIAHSNSHNENARKAVELLGYMRDYREALKNAQQEIMQDRFAGQLRREIEQWEPNSAFLVQAFGGETSSTRTAVTTTTLPISLTPVPGF